MAPDEPPFTPGEILYGTSAIASFLGVRNRQALYLVESGRIPFFKVGRTICARRSSLASWLAEQEAKAKEGGR